MRLKNYFILSALIFMVCFLQAGNGYSARLSGGKEVASPQQKETDNEINTEANPGTERAGRETSRLVQVDFDNIDIIHLINFISDLTGKNFIVDPGVKGKVTVISPTKVTVAEAYKTFESVLEVNGLSTVPSGKSIKIVPMRDARTKDIETRFGDARLSPQDRVITQIIPLTYSSPTELNRVLSGYKSKDGLMIPYDQTGVLIVTDVESNISRIIEIIKKIDIPGTGEEITVIPLEKASAKTMAASLRTVFRAVLDTGRKTAPGATSQITIEPDERTNSLIVVASEVDTLKIKQLIKLLDKDTQGQGDIHVYFLQNADAEGLANTLNAIPKDTRQTGQQGAAAQVITKDTKIIADKATNSLIITAQKDEYEIIENVIRKLDRPRSMVFIEALVMEVSMKKEFDIGVQWQIGKQNDSEVVYSASNPGVNNFPSISDNGVSLPTGWTSGILGDTITIGGIEFADLGAVFRAYATDSDVQIYSNPQVMTLDNEEADLSVTDNIPYITRRDEGISSGNIAGYSNYDFKDVGVKLKITPQINQERYVQLKIEQEVSQVSSTDQAGQPRTFIRTVNTTVRIKDGQTVVIGGLIDTVDDRTNYRVPLLGRIPVLGWLFRSRTTSADKKNLYLFVTPRIIENREEADEIYETKKGHIDTIKQGVVRLHNDGKQPEDMRRVDLGYKYLQLKDYEKALKYYQKALDKNPGNPYAIYNTGYIYQMQGETDRAIEMYEKLISMDPPDRAVETSDPFQAGRKLTDMAKDNLKSLKADE